MRLTELEPKWLTDRGKLRGVVFKCPHCRKEWLTCFFEPTPIFSSNEFPDWWKEHNFPPPGTQSRMVIDALELDVMSEFSAFVPCKKDIGWAHTGNTFDALTITPSLDASAAGHWHGFITSGGITP